MPNATGVRSVASNQNAVHADLEKLVRRYLDSQYQRPFAWHTIEAFKQAKSFISSFTEPVVLDSGCGNGESTFVLATKFPKHPVIGIDKSLFRISKSESKEQPVNALFLQAELLDFWRLALQAEWKVCYHALYYPNPWPKESQVGRRFHAHPIFPTLLKLCSNIELRTNWKTYAEEFLEASQIAINHLQVKATPVLEQWLPKDPETAFERKYLANGQALWRVKKKI